MTKPAFGMPSELWTERREASLNWLALGLLLAAWNAAEDPGPLRQRPQALRGCATVRSMARASAANPDDAACPKVRA